MIERPGTPFPKQAAQNLHNGYDRPDVLSSPRPTPPSESIVRDQVSFLEEQIKGLFAGADALEERLDTILRPSAPGTGVGSGREERAESHLVARLRMLNEALAALANRFQSLHGRVEL